MGKALQDRLVSRRCESSKPSSCTAVLVIGGAEAEPDTQPQVESETGCLGDRMKNRTMASKPSCIHCFFFPTLTFWLTSELSGAPCWQDQGSTVPDQEHTLPPSLTKSGTEKSLQYLLQDVAGSFTKQDQQGLNPTAATDSCTDFM